LIQHLFLWSTSGIARFCFHAHFPNGTLEGPPKRFQSGERGEPLLWLVRDQEARREAFIEERRQIKERGFLAVMWPQLLVFLVILFIWFRFVRWYF